MSHQRHVWPGGRPMWCPSCAKRVIPPGLKLCARCEAELLEDVAGFIDEMEAQ